MIALLKLNGMYLANTQHSNSWETEPTLTEEKHKAMKFCPVKILELVETYKEYWDKIGVTHEVEEMEA